MKGTWPLLLTIAASLLTACASEEYYKVPNSLADYAIIDDQNFVTRESLAAESAARILSVDRVKVHEKRRLLTADVVESLTDQQGRNLENIEGINLMNAIPLSPGEHKLLVEACEVDAVVLSMTPWTPYMYCANAVIRLDAEPHGLYFLGGSVSRDEDYADIWIEDLRDRTLAVEKVRIKGLKIR